MIFGFFKHGKLAIPPRNWEFRTLSASITFDGLADSASLPAIAHWDQIHFVVVYNIKKGKIYVADPAHGLIKYSKEEFLKHWASAADDKGIILLFEPTPKLLEQDEYEKRSKFGMVFFSHTSKHIAATGCKLFLAGLLEV